MKENFPIKFVRYDAAEEGRAAWALEVQGEVAVSFETSADATPAEALRTLFTAQH